MKVKFLTIALALTTLVACQNNTENKSAAAGEGQDAGDKTAAAPNTDPNINDKNTIVIGKWQAVEWLLGGMPSGENPSKLHFEFMEDGTFKANYGDQHKSGTWRTDKDVLYTTQAGMKELPMKMLKADGAALELEMDVKGKPEVYKFRKD